MKIWMGGTDVSGQSSLMAEALQALGHTVNRLPLERANEDEVFHILGPDGRPIEHELQVAARPGRMGIFHFWGPDIRTEEMAALRNPYARFIGHFAGPEAVAADLRKWGQKIHACIVPDVECVTYVRPFFKRIYVLPYAMNGQLQATFPDGPPPEEPLIVHAPASTHGEGTAFVYECLERLRRDGLRFRTIVRQGLSREARTDLFRQADIVVDQLLTGAYGPAAADAMALGKPVLSYIRPEQRGGYPGTAVVPANPATLYRRLSELINASGLRKEIGARGAEYARKVHRPGRIANKLAWIYDREARMLSGEMAAEQEVVHNLYVISADELEGEPGPPAAGSFRLYPNRLLRRKRGTYVSFNLAEVPAHAVISNAVMHVPVMRKPRAAVAIHRIIRGWDRRSAIRRKRLPRIAKKSIVRLPAAGRRKASRRRTRWVCTPLAQRWQREQLKNHGVLIKRSLRAAPYLDVTVST